MRRCSPVLSNATFLTRDANTPAPAWDTKGRLEDVESLYGRLKTQLVGVNNERSDLTESLNIYKTRGEYSRRSPLYCSHVSVEELNQMRAKLSQSNESLSEELGNIKDELRSSMIANEDATRKFAIELEDVARHNRNTINDIQDNHRREIESTRNKAIEERERLERDQKVHIDDLMRDHAAESASLRDRLSADFEQNKQSVAKQVEQVRIEAAAERQSYESRFLAKDRELQDAQIENQALTTRLTESNAALETLKSQLEASASNTQTLNASAKAYKAKVEFLESDSQAQSQAFASLNQRMQQAIEQATLANEKLRAEETLRRRLHNQVQELKGNIRVFCRVRPTLSSEEDTPAKIGFPDSDVDCKEVAIQGHEQRSALGNVTTATNGFSFDRVFSPSAQNEQVFEEISQLVQSALDGYNVCIFCYGQTGSGKTHTMSAPDGMIPRAVAQIYETAGNLKEKGWTYVMEGSFIEVYNETLNDLLGKAEDWEKKKHEIKHDPTKQKTIVTDVNSIMLDSPEAVHSILERANRNRVVAATKANARSSRSHSVFILRLTGDNSVTGEHSEGTLNLVDLAGSERLSHSGATGERMKETQHINKSLSCLGDVIGALGQNKDGGHVPYRNSKV